MDFLYYENILFYEIKMFGMGFLTLLDTNLVELIAGYLVPVYAGADRNRGEIARNAVSLFNCAEILARIL